MLSFGLLLIEGLRGADPEPQGDLFLMLDGLLALFEVSLWVVVGISGIAWVMSRR